MLSWQLIKEVLIAIYQHFNIKAQFNLFDFQIYAQTVKELADYAEKFTYYASLAAPYNWLTL